MSNPSEREANIGIPEREGTLPSDFPIPPATTGTVDDDDDPSDERADENEARVRENNDNTDAAEEFEYNDEDQNSTDE